MKKLVKNGARGLVSTVEWLEKQRIFQKDKKKLLNATLI